MNCKKCNAKMPSARVTLGYVHCVDCSEVDTYGCVDIVYHKTGNTVQVLSKDQAAAINKHSRKRFGTVLKGGSKSTTYKPTNIRYGGASSAFIGTQQLFEEVGAQVMKVLDSKGFEAASLYVDRQVQNLNISGSQAFKLKQIIKHFTQHDTSLHS